MMDFRDMFLIRPDLVYLNHGAQGACPRPVFEAYQARQVELERDPAGFGARYAELMGEAREALGGLIGAGADDLVYVTNVTTAINIVARSLELGPGDEVLGTDHEYGAMDRTWRFICDRTGARYIRQPIPVPATSADETVAAIWAGVTDRTRVLYFSHITSPTAMILPAAGLVRRAREAGIITVIDGAHAAGQVPLDLAGLGVDFYGGNCHKWMMAPKGSGFLYARPGVQDMLDPLVVSWGWGREEPRVSKFVDEHQDCGTRDPAAFLSVPVAIRFMAEHSWPAVQRECHEVVRYGRGRLTSLTGLHPLTPDSPEWYGQMAALPLPDCDPGDLSRKLRERFAVVVPVFEWNGRRLLRLSIQAYNSRADVDVLVDGLEALLPAA